MIRLVLDITANGIQVIRADELLPDFTITVEQQAATPKLGLICATSNYSEVERVIMGAVTEIQQNLAAYVQRVKNGQVD